MHYDLLKKKSKYYKESKEGVAEMCKIMEDMRNEAMEESARNTKIEVIIKMMKNLKLSAEEAMNVLDIPAEEQQYYMKRIQEA